MAKIGDKVFYVPHICHGTPETDTWVVGIKRIKHSRKLDAASQQVTNPPQSHHIPGIPQPPITPKLIEEIEELHGDKLDQHLEILRSHPNAEEERKKLVYIRPNVRWNAVITQVHGDASVDLDIESNVSGMTLHYSKIIRDPTKNTPHSYHE
jgi:hypothetical protein